MKTWIKLWMVISILWMGYGAAAQTSEPYWVVEGNLNKPDYTIIHFYNSQHQKISEERVEGRFLDISKKRNVTLLNKKLSRLTETSNGAFARNNRKDSVK